MVRSSGEPNQDVKSKPSSGITSNKEGDEVVQKLVVTMHGIEPLQTLVNASLVPTPTSENRKEFWAFVGWKSKGKKKNIASLKSDTGLSLTSTRGKLEVPQRHYQLLSKMSVDGVFDANWKGEVEDNVNGYSSLSEEVTDSLLDKEIEKGDIAKFLRNLKNSKTGGSDRIVGELLKYGGSGMVGLLEQLFSVVWQVEIVPRQWREGLNVNNYI